MTEKNVGQAVDLFLDDQHDAANTDQLNRWISEDSTKAKTAFRRFLLHVLLEQYYAQRRMRRQMGLSDSIDHEAPRRWYNSRWVLISLLTVASTALIVLSLILAYSFFEWSARYDPVAAAAAARQAALAASQSPFLITSPEYEWAPGFEVPRSPEELFGKKLELKQGLAAVNYRNGNQVLLQAPCALTADPKGIVMLERGAMAMEFSETRQQKVLSTPQADIYAATGTFAACIKDDRLYLRFLRGSAQTVLRGNAGTMRPLPTGVPVCIRDGKIENLEEETADTLFGPALQAVMSKNATKRPAMPVAYDGFAYPAAMTVEQQDSARNGGMEGLQGGWGWDGPWREINPCKAIVRANDAEAATARAAILAYADPSGAVLLRQGGLLSTGIGAQSVTRRTLLRSAFPSQFVDDSGIGANGSILWISFLSCAIESGEDRFGYLQLSDGQKGVRIGRLPGDKNTWGLSSMRKRGEQAFSEISCSQPSYIVAQINFRNGAEHVMVWVNPEWKKTPKPGLATMQMFVPDFRLNELSIVGRNAIDFDEIRIGTSFGAVAPFEK